MPSLDLLNIVKWLVIAALVVGAVVGLAAIGGTVAGGGTDQITHFFHTYQGSLDPEVGGDGASEVSPQTWAMTYILRLFGPVWSGLFAVVALFVVAFGAFVAARYVIRALS